MVVVQARQATLTDGLERQAYAIVNYIPHYSGTKNSASGQWTLTALLCALCVQDKTRGIAEHLT